MYILERARVKNRFPRFGAPIPLMDGFLHDNVISQILEFAHNSKHTSMGYSPFMLMYGFQPRASIDINIHHDELRSTQNFLRGMQDMLHIARDNIKIAQDRARFYVDHNRQARVFSPGQKVFLRVPHNSKTLSTGKCAKLSPRFCGPFTVLKCIGSLTYRLALPDGVEIHPVFHVSRLKELLGSGDNIVTTETLVTSEELSTKPHVQK